MLPEPSVELLYNSSKDPEINKEISEGLNRNFMLRTTEKEPELVQTCLDQVLRDKDKKQLLLTVFAHASDPDPKNNDVRIRFYLKEPDPSKELGPADAWAAPSFVKSLLHRELRRSSRLAGQREEHHQQRRATVLVVRLTWYVLRSAHLERTKGSSQSTHLQNRL